VCQLCGELSALNVFKAIASYGGTWIGGDELSHSIRVSFRASASVCCLEMLRYIANLACVFTTQHIASRRAK